MTKTDTADVGATVAQIEEMVRAGCEVVRLAVPDNDAAIALKEIRKRVPDVPLVADIHFHYKLALMALEAAAYVSRTWGAPAARPRDCGAEAVKTTAAAAVTATTAPPSRENG